MSTSGKIIIFDGCDGSGKSTMIGAVENELVRLGIPFTSTFAIGGSAIGSHIRNRLFSSNKKTDPIQEMLWMASCIYENFNEVVLPAKEKGDIVLLDRFIASYYSYQLRGRSITQNHFAPPSTTASLSIAAFHALESAFLKSESPIDLYLSFDVPVEIGEERTKNRGDANYLDNESYRFKTEIRNAYLDYFRLYTSYGYKHKQMIMADRPIEVIKEQVLDEVMKIVKEDK